MSTVISYRVRTQCSNKWKSFHFFCVTSRALCGEGGIANLLAHLLFFSMATDSTLEISEMEALTSACGVGVG